MTSYPRSSAVLVAAFASLAAVPAVAQSADAEVAREIAAMRAEMSRMAARIDTLEAELAAAKQEAAAAPAPASTPAPPLAEKNGDDPITQVAWKGAPEFTSEGGWSFKPRGRIQLDAGTVSAPDGITDASTGFGSEVRRAFLGFEGKIPGGFGYRAEIDVAASAVEITDLYLTYNPSKEVTLTVGQHKPFWGLEELTSDLFPSFTERAAINNAFGYERRLGASAAYAHGPILLQAGVFSDNVADLNNDENNAWSADGRVVFMPKLAGGQLHLGGSAHFRQLNNGADNVRYRVRPFIHTPDIRFIDTGAITARGETGYGLEAAFIKGPFHAAGEAHWQQVDRIDGTDPTFFGYYVEAGMFLTKGDTRGYRGGVFDRTRPANPVGKGGIGAIQLNARYDYLDLIDAGWIGGTQKGYELSISWTPTDYTRFIANYGRLNYSDAALPAEDGDRSYGVDAFGLRAQVDF
jgi:phosphate-selective porin OprO/OprP